MAPTAVKFKFTHVPRQKHELARLKVVQGPDFGAVFVVTDSRATIGRGDENDIVLSDLKSSRRHAQLVMANNQWEVSDWGSANGIIVNGKPTPKTILRSRDVVTIGETSLEFFGDETGTQQLTAPARPGQLGMLAGQVQAGKAIRSGNAQKNTKPALLLVGAALVFYLVLSDSQPDPQKVVSKIAQVPIMKGAGTRDLASFLPQAEGSSTNRTAEIFFRSGFREYRERNFLRARAQFETALQLAPGHFLATMYLENCKKEITNEINFHLEQGKKNFDSGKLKLAKGHFEAVLRLLYREPSNPSYLEAKDQLGKVDKEIKKGDLG